MTWNYTINTFNWHGRFYSVLASIKMYNFLLMSEKKFYEYHIGRLINPMETHNALGLSQLARKCICKKIHFPNTILVFLYYFFSCVAININMLRHISAWIATFEKSHVPPVAMQSMYHWWYIWRCVRMFSVTTPFDHQWTYIFIQNKYSVEWVEYTLKSTIHCCHCTNRSTNAKSWRYEKTSYVWCGGSSERRLYHRWYIRR